ncbi:MAG: hypothetical protein ABEI77_04060 [Halorientalis sp.]
MTLTPNDNTESTEAETTDELLSEDEFVDMGWPSNIAGVDSSSDRVHFIASSLADTGILDRKEAQAFALREIAGVELQRAADETEMSTREIERALRSAGRKVSQAREFIEILDDSDC